MDTRGRHILAELDGCDPDLLADADGMRGLMEQAARVAELSVLAAHVVQFQESGVSGVLILAESHFSIHTWPEHGYAAVDVYTCGPHGRPELAIAHLSEHIGARRIGQAEFLRGEPRTDGGHDFRLISSARAERECSS